MHENMHKKVYKYAWKYAHNQVKINHERFSVFICIGISRRTFTTETQSTISRDWGGRSGGDFQSCIYTVAVNVRFLGQNNFYSFRTENLRNAYKKVRQLTICLYYL